MKRHLAILLALSIFAIIPAARAGSDISDDFCFADDESSWIFQPSYFSHDPASGTRVAQYIPEPVSFARDDPTYLESGYRHDQQILRGPDGSADRIHIVQTWGMGEFIRPYGEWEFPFRAGATPFGPWGNPQGPWTMPFDSWQNPYGLLQHLPGAGGYGWPDQNGPGPGGYPYGGSYGYGPGYGNGPGYGGGAGPAYGRGAGPGSYMPSLPQPGH
jgi:hypothetical protein